MKKICEICEKTFETKSSTIIYYYECSEEATRTNKETRKHQNTILRRNMKKQTLKYIVIGSNCYKEIHGEIGYKYEK